MQINLRHNSSSVREYGRISTPWWRRGFRMLRNVRVLIYLCLGLFFGGQEIVRGLQSTPANTNEVEKGALILLAILALLAFLLWRQQAAVNKTLSAQGDQQMAFSSTGLTTTGLDGASTFEPWSTFSSFREGKHLIALQPRGKGQIRAIPTSELTPNQIGELRSILLSNLPGPGLG